MTQPKVPGSDPEPFIPAGQLQETAALLDEPSRRMLLENIPWNRELAAELGPPTTAKLPGQWGDIDNLRLLTYCIIV